MTVKEVSSLINEDPLQVKVWLRKKQIEKGMGNKIPVASLIDLFHRNLVKKLLVACPDEVKNDPEVQETLKNIQILRNQIGEK